MTYRREDLIADMTGLDVPTMHDILDDRIAADRDFTPVPAEFQGLAFPEIVEILDEQAREEAAYWESMNSIPQRWQ